MRLRTIAVVLAITTTLGVVTATAAQASRHPSATTTVGPAALRAAGGPGSVPWATVGPGWLLATWSPRTAHRSLAAATSQYLVLIAPTGTRYLIAAIATPDVQLLSWSGDGQRALLQAGVRRTTLEVMDLHTGTVAHAFDFPTSNSVFFNTARFTRPQGFAIDVSTQTNNHQLLTRYSVDGTAQQTYPASFSRIGRYSGAFLSSPDGTQLVMGAQHGLAVVSNGATVVAQLPIGGAGYCQPQRWWSATVVLASCGSPSRLYEFSVTGGAPKAVTRVPRPPDSGDLSAWRVDHATYVQVASACGYEYLARLHGATPVRIMVPGVPIGNTVTVIGASPHALAVEATIACMGGASLLSYTPSTRSARVVLGHPATGGEVNGALVYPPPLG
ncbi:MAG TPA: hypothetical protein VGZ03_06205 [Acidimicrobiales bacterium]|nr:hypothetical protein [Acidimicrobiales bacterium]